MTTSPPSIGPAPIRTAFVNDKGLPSPVAAGWMQQLLDRVGGATGKPIIGEVRVYQTTVAHGDLAAAASKTLLDAQSGEQWKVREIFLSGAGTNFSGGGDRLLSITDGTTIWSVIPAATLQSLAVARWGDTGVPFPATAAHLTTASASGTDIVAKYSGGATDYTAGSLTLVLTCERVA